MQETINIQGANSPKNSVIALSGGNKSSNHSVVSEDSTEPAAAKRSFSDSMKKAFDDSSTDNSTTEASADGKTLPVSAEDTAVDDRDIQPGFDITVLSNIESEDESISLLNPHALPIDLKQDNSKSGISLDQSGRTIFSANVLKTDQASLLDAEVQIGQKSALLASPIRQLTPDTIVSSSGVAVLNLQNIKDSVMKTNNNSSDVNSVQIDSTTLNPDDAALDDMSLPMQKTQLIKQMLAASSAQSQIIPELQSMSSSRSAMSTNPDMNIIPSPVSSPISSFSSVLQALPQAEISTLFGRADWSQGMSKQILWLANQNIKSAEIRLNPAHLGPIEVRLEINDEQINVALSSRHAVVREAMEAALPKLREMLDSNGMNLSDADISQHSFAEQRQQNANNTTGDSLKTSVSLTETEQNEEIPLNLNLLSSSMVDYYI